MNDGSFISLRHNINLSDKSFIVSSGKINDNDEAVSANDIINNNVVNDKSGNNQLTTYQNNNDMYNIAGNVDAGKKVLACSNEEKADSAIDSDTKVNISIVSSGNILDITKAVPANEFVDYDMVNDKSEKIQPSTYHNYNDTYSDAGNLDCRKTLISFSSEGKAESDIDCDLKMNISINEEKKNLR